MCGVHRRTGYFDEVQRCDGLVSVKVNGAEDQGPDVVLVGFDSYDAEERLVFSNVAVVFWDVLVHSP